MHFYTLQCEGEPYLHYKCLSSPGYSVLYQQSGMVFLILGDKSLLNLRVDGDYDGWVQELYGNAGQSPN